MKEFAQEILKATTLHFQNSLILSLEKDEAKKAIAVNNMKQAEDILAETLEKFREQVIMEAKS